MLTQEFDLKIIPDSGPVVVHVNQYDIGEGRLIISLYKDETPYNPSTGATVAIQGMKADTHGFDYAASLSGNVVTANVTKQMTAAAGITRCQVVVSEGDNVTGTFVFFLDVQKSALPADADMSASDYQLVQEMIDAAEAAEGGASESAQAAAASARSAATSESNSEAWAVGTRDGEPVPETDETYHNNSKYFVDDAAQSASDAADSASAAATSEVNAAASETNAAASESNAAISESNAEAWAVGERGGQTVPSTDPTYRNNSKFYAESAEDSEDNAFASEQRAKASEQAAKASEEILQYYVDFVIPRFVIQNNRLYISNAAEGEFIVANNRLYIKNASSS